MNPDYRDSDRAPTPEKLPLSERIWCAIVLGILIAGAVWISVVLK